MAFLGRRDRQPELMDQPGLDIRTSCRPERIALCEFPSVEESSRHVAAKSNPSFRSHQRVGHCESLTSPVEAATSFCGLPGGREKPDSPSGSTVAI